jgi:transcriptional regulator with XRE-family HTH domain
VTEEKPSTGAVAWAYNEFIKGDPKRVAHFKVVRAQSALARSVYDIRKKLNMTREALAERSGLTPEIIEDLEESDYDGDWVDVIRKIEQAFAAWVKEVLAPTYKPEQPRQPWDLERGELAALLDTLHQQGVELYSSAGAA